jgi:uncharacterized protein (TIRG00374 family)
VKKLWLVSGLVLGAVMLTAAAHYVDGAQLLRVLRDVDFGFATLAVLASLSFLFVKAWRWAVLLSPLRRMRARDLAPAVCVGTAANLIVPHAGEFARVFLVAERDSLPASALLASIVLERLFDFGAVLALLGVMVMLGGSMPQALVSASLVAAGLLVLLLIVSAFAAYRSELALRVLAWFLRLLPRRLADALQAQAASAIDGLAALRSGHVLARAMLVSLIQWSTIVLLSYASARAVGAHIPVAAAIAVVALMVAGLTLPAAPIYVGTTQLAFAFALAPFGVDSAYAIAASLIYTVFGLLPMLLAGAVYFIGRRRGNGGMAHHVG